MLESWKKWAISLEEQTYALYLASRDERINGTVRTLLVLIAAYALSPIDLIPDFIPVIGYLDDLIILPLAISLAIKLIPNEIWDACKKEAHDKLEPDAMHSMIAAAVIIAIWIAVSVAVLAWLWHALRSGWRLIAAYFGI